jgi:hypothetical protein
LGELASEFEADPTPERLFEIDHEDALVVEAMAVGKDGVLQALVSAPDSADIERARAVGQPTILVARRGTRLPFEMWCEMKSRAMASDNQWTRDVRVVKVSVFDHVIGPDGVQRGADALFAPECAPCPELLVGGGL